MPEEQSYWEIEAKKAQQKYDDLIIYFKDKLSPLKILPGISDEAWIKTEFEELLKVEKKLQDAEDEKKKIQEDADRRIGDLLKELGDIKKAQKIEKEEHERKMKNLVVRVEKAEVQVKEMQASHFLQKTFFSLFEKPKKKRKPKTRFGRLLTRLQGKV